MEYKTSRQEGRKAKRQAGRQADRKADREEVCRTVKFVGLKIGYRPPSRYSSGTPLVMTPVLVISRSIGRVRVGRGMCDYLKFVTDKMDCQKDASKKGNEKDSILPARQCFSYCSSQQLRICGDNKAGHTS